MATYEQWMEAARRADAAGDGSAAKRFLELAQEAKSGQSPRAQGLNGEMSLEQKRALALARARKAKAEAEAQGNAQPATSGMPPPVDTDLGGHGCSPSLAGSRRR